jgi:hypothetical protein
VRVAAGLGVFFWRLGFWLLWRGEGPGPGPGKERVLVKGLWRLILFGRLKGGKDGAFLGWGGG